MIRLGAILFSVLVALSACTDISNGNFSISELNSDTIRLRHLDSVNALRAERGAQPLQLSAQLDAAANTHARDMAQQQRAWNFGSDGTSPQDRAVRAGFSGIVRGENVAETFMDEFLVLQTWLDDPAARASILDPSATHLGYGWYQESNGKLWWVQVLGQEKPPLLMAQSQ